LRTGQDPELDFALYNWILEQQKKGTPISNKSLQDEARLISKSFNKNGVFQASEGWLEKFKRRFGIKLRVATGIDNIRNEKVKEYENPDKIPKVGIVLLRVGDRGL